jgi:hypothetical protein
VICNARDSLDLGVWLRLRLSVARVFDCGCFHTPLMMIAIDDDLNAHEASNRNVQ